MAEPKLIIKMLNTEWVEREATVCSHALIPSWIMSNSRILKSDRCAKCQVEFEDDGKLILAVDSDRGTLFLHTACYDQIITY